MSDPGTDLMTELNAVKAVNVNLSDQNTTLQAQLAELEDLRWLVGHLTLTHPDTPGIPAHLMPAVMTAVETHNPDQYAEDLLIAQPEGDVMVDEDA